MARAQALPHHQPVMRHAALFIFCLVCLIAVASPGYGGLGNRIDPMVWGLPFALLWNMLWVALSFVALGLYHLSDKES